MIEQQYYTSASKRLDGNSGFGIKAQSPGMAPQVSKALEQYARYGKPYQIDEQDMEKMPISFSFYEVEDGVWGMTCSRYIGQDFSGRWGNFFAHAVAFSHGDLEALYLAPIQLERASLWVGADASDNTVLPALTALPSVINVGLDDTPAFLQAQPERDVHFAEMLQALIGLKEMGRRLILVDSPENISQWIAALTCALPLPLRRYLTFSTYQRDPYAINLAVVGTRTDGDFRFSAAEYQFQFAVFNFENRQYSTGIVPGRAAVLLTDTLTSGDSATLEAIYDLALRLEAAEMQTLDSLAAIAQVQRWPGGARRAPVEVIEATREALRPASPEARREALALARRFSQDVMAAGDQERLALLLPVYDSLARQTQNEEALGQDIMRFVRQRIRTNQGLETLRFLARQETDLPLIGEIVKQGMTAQDWTSFLDNAMPGEADLRDLWPQLEPPAMRAAAQNELTLWRALAAWATGRNSSLVLKQLEARLASASGNDLQTLRVITDTIAPQTPPQHVDAMIQLCLALLEKGLASHDGRWQDDIARCTGAMSAMQREAAFLPRLLNAAGSNSKALVFSLNSVLEGNPPLIPTATKALIESRLFQSQSFLREAFQDPRLAELFRELWHDTARGGQLSLFLRALLDSLPVGRDSAAERGLLYDGIRELAACAHTAAEFDTFFRDIPEVGRDTGAYGIWLIGKLRLSPLTILEDNQALEALRKALEKLPEEQLDAPSNVNVYLSFRLSKAAQSLENKGAAWSFANKYLALDPAMRIDAAVYSTYVQESLQLLVRCKAPLVTTEDIFETLLVNARLPEFIDAYLDYLTAYKREPQQVGQAVYYTLSALGKRWNYAKETIPLCARLVKCLRGSEQEILNREFLSLLSNRPLAKAWWIACYDEGTKTFLSRLFNR